MAAQFGNPVDLKKLDAFLLEKSYISGWTFSGEDVAVFNNISAAPSGVNALRWWNHIQSFKSEFGNVPAASAPAAAEAEDDEDDVDEAAEALKAKRVAEYNARKAAKEETKGKVIAKSSITFDVKPWDDETDLDEVDKMIRAIAMDGLLWGVSKIKPLAYGIFKLTILCVVEDDKVSSDDLVEQIEAFEDHVQSVDIAAFNKI